MSKESQGHRYGPVLSPMAEDFKPSDPHSASEECITNGVPGYPKGSDRIADEVVYWEGGHFGKFPRDYKGGKE